MVQYCQSETNDAKSFQAGSRIRSTEKITNSHILSGKTITQMTFYLNRNNVGNTPIKAGIWDKNGANFIQMATIDSDTLPLDPLPQVTTIFTGVNCPMTGDYSTGYIGIEQDPSGGTAIFQMDTNPGTDMDLYFYNDNTSNWDLQSNQRLKFCATYAGGSTLLPPSPAYVKL